MASIMSGKCVFIEADVNACVVKAQAEDRAHLVSSRLQVIDVQVNLGADLVSTHLVTHLDDKRLNLIREKFKTAIIRFLIWQNFWHLH
jgi:hypothetical protein